MKILVTGGAGFIGNVLVRRLLKDGHTVRVMDDYSRGVPRRLTDIADKIEMVQGDVRIAEEVDRAVAGMDVVFHLAAVNGTENFYNAPDRVLEVAVKGTMNTMDSAIKHKVKRYLFASSSEAYQEPTHVPTTENERLIVPDVKNARLSYGGGKLIGELLALHYLQKRGIDTIIFRPHNIYGPDMGNEHVVPQFIARLKDLQGTEFKIQGSGKETRAFCNVDDMVDGLVILMEKGVPGEVYHVGTDREVTITQVAEILAKAMGKQITIVPGELTMGSTPRRCPDITKMRALGYEPKVDLEEGMTRTAKEELERLSKA
jgi:nucleoside-diphosphate-sugar epimerase